MGREYLGMREWQRSRSELTARYRSFWLVDDSANSLHSGAARNYGRMARRPSPFRFRTSGCFVSLFAEGTA